MAATAAHVEGLRSGGDGFCYGFSGSFGSGFHYDCFGFRYRISGLLEEEVVEIQGFYRAVVKIGSEGQREGVRTLFQLDLETGQILRQLLVFFLVIEHDVHPIGVVDADVRGARHALPPCHEGDADVVQTIFLHLKRNGKVALAVVLQVYVVTAGACVGGAFLKGVLKLHDLCACVPVGFFIQGGSERVVLPVHGRYRNEQRRAQYQCKYSCK